MENLTSAQKMDSYGGCCGLEFTAYQACLEMGFACFPNLLFLLEKETIYQIIPTTLIFPVRKKRPEKKMEIYDLCCLSKSRSGLLFKALRDSENRASNCCLKLNLLHFFVFSSKTQKSRKFRNILLWSKRARVVNFKLLLTCTENSFCT